MKYFISHSLSLWMGIPFLLVPNTTHGFSIPSEHSTCRRRQSSLHSFHFKTRSTYSNQTKISNSIQDENKNADLQKEQEHLSSIPISQRIQAFLKSTTSANYGPPPPLQVEDTSLLLYDVFLLLNLTVSISFWVVHRMNIDQITPAISEGSLLSILWIISGLRHGSFLYSAVDGHYDPSDVTLLDARSQDDRKARLGGGPKSAFLLGLNTMIGTANLRILVAFLSAVVQHRRVGSMYGEELIPLEIAFGIILMSLWRLLHSRYTIR